MSANNLTSQLLSPHDHHTFSTHSNEDYGLKMADMENKMKKEVEKIEEALLKRISEKDKQITKMK